MSTSSTATFPKFHTSLNVSDLNRSIDFYRALLGIEPAKCRPDYAKFEVAQPPLVLSLLPGRITSGGTLNHIGISLPNSEELVKIQMRLEAAGIRTKREEGVECCYARQTKFWVTDPDRTLWELYVFHEDIAEHGHGHVPEKESVSSFAEEVPNERVVWQHRLRESAFPSKIPHVDNSVHEILFEGTCNARADMPQIDSLLADAKRALRPGGEVRIHGLAGNTTFTGANLELPGPASSVQQVLGESDIMNALLRAGFVDVRFEKLSQKAYFVVDGVQMREIMIAGRKPGHRPKTLSHQAVYLGPLASATDDYGNVYPRGERVSINIHDWQALSKGAAANSFLLLTPEECLEGACCGA